MQGKEVPAAYFSIASLLSFTSPYLTNSKHPFLGARGIRPFPLLCFVPGEVEPHQAGLQLGLERRAAELGPCCGPGKAAQGHWAKGATAHWLWFHSASYTPEVPASVTHSRTAASSGLDLSFEDCGFEKEFKRHFLCKFSFHGF